MSDDKSALVSISDVFGLGKIADSRAANRLVDAIVSGVGELAYPWRTRRTVRAQLDAAKAIDRELPDGIDAALELDERVRTRLLTSQREHQLNRENIAGKAIEDLKDSAEHEEAPEEHIEPDWIEYYWSKAETVSDEDMQSLWSRILARKAVGHKIGLRTLDLLRTLSTEEAKIIQELAQYKIAIGPDHPYWRNSVGLLFYPAVSFEHDERKSPDKITVRGNEVVATDDSPVESRCRELIGNHFPNVLGPIGIYADSSRLHSFALNWPSEPLPVQIGDENFIIEGLPGGSNEGYGLVEFGTGVGFSQIGWEVFSLAKTAPNAQYVEVIRERLKERGLSLTRSDR